ncbi:hypothetical protein [Lysinibacillus sp. RC79]|uniref:hypothetical protein n=1 Tax=Lysinibacillus sp. RC79 TaxID=3156296 RepID=UPI003518F0FE
MIQEPDKNDQSYHMDFDQSYAFIKKITSKCKKHFKGSAITNNNVMIKLMYKAAPPINGVQLILNVLILPSIHA